MTREEEIWQQIRICVLIAEGGLIHCDECGEWYPKGDKHEHDMRVNGSARASNGGPWRKLSPRNGEGEDTPHQPSPLAEPFTFRRTYERQNLH